MTEENWNVFEHGDVSDEDSWFVHWRVDKNEQHYIPTSESNEHDYSTSCRCKPDVKLIDEEDLSLGYKVTHSRFQKNLGE